MVDIDPQLVRPAGLVAYARTPSRILLKRLIFEAGNLPKIDRPHTDSPLMSWE